MQKTSIGEDFKKGFKDTWQLYQMRLKDYTKEKKIFKVYWFYLLKKNLIKLKLLKKKFNLVLKKGYFLKLSSGDKSIYLARICETKTEHIVKHWQTIYSLF